MFKPLRLVVLGACMAACLAGCVGMDDLEGLRAQAASLRDSVDAQARAAQAAIADLDQRGTPPDDPARAQAQERARTLQAQQQALDDALARADAVLAEARQPSTPLTQGLSALAPALPEPLRSPLLLGGALVAALLRGRQLKAGLASVALGIEKAKQADPAFKAAFESNANTFRSIQTSAAARVVDEATRQGFMLRLPV